MGGCGLLPVSNSIHYFKFQIFDENHYLELHVLVLLY